MSWLIWGGIVIAIVIAIAIGLYSYNTWAIHRAEMRFPPAGQFITVDGVRLHYLCRGSGSPVVLIHGNAGTFLDFSMNILDPLAQQHQVYVFDRPGHGYSDRPSASMTPTEQAALLHKALQQINVEQPLLVGHSWGGVLVLAYALRYPQQTTGLVLLSALVYEFNVPLPPRQIAQSSALPILLKFLPTILFGRVMIQQILNTAFSPEPVPADYAEGSKALWTRPRQIQATVQDSVILRSELEELRSQYPTIHLPTWIVTGDQDQLVDAEQNSYALHRAIAHSKLIVLPHTGHATPHTRPEAIVEAINTASQLAQTVKTVPE